MWLFLLSFPLLTLCAHGKLLTEEEYINLALLWFRWHYDFFFVPLLVVSSSYFCIFESAKKQFQRILAGENLTIYKNDVRARSMQSFKAIKTIGFVLGARTVT